MNPSLTLGNLYDFDSITGTVPTPILVYDFATGVDPQVTNLGTLSLNLNNPNNRVLIEGNLPFAFDESLAISLGLIITVAGVVTTIPITIDTGIALFPVDATVNVYRGLSAVGTPIYTETQTIAAPILNIAQLINSLLDPTTPESELFFDVMPFQFVDEGTSDSCTLATTTTLTSNYFVTLSVTAPITDTILGDLLTALVAAINALLDAIFALLAALGIGLNITLDITIEVLQLFLQPNYSVVAQEVSE